VAGNPLGRGLSWAELARVVAYLADHTTGARVQKVRQPAPDKLVFEARAPGQSYWVTLAVHPRFFRVVVETENPGVPSEASAFCGLMRKHLVGGRIEEVALDPGDRIVTWRVLHREGEDEVVAWTLVVELFAAKSNVLFLGPDGRLVAALLDKRLPTRGLKAGDIYEPPESVGEPTRDDRGIAIEDMASAFGQAEDEYDWTRAAQQLQNAVSRERTRRRRFLKKVTRELEGLPDDVGLSAHGELLVANLHAVKRGQTEVSLPDWHEPGAMVTVELDPALSPQKNADRLFKTARRTRRKREHLQQQRTEATRLDEALAQVAERAEELTMFAPLEELTEEILALGVPLAKPRQAPPRKREEKPSGPQPFFAEDGAEIYVGRSDRENDEITFQVARGNDYWLHVEGAPGSHVVVKLPANGELSPETLVDAATLTLLNSSLKNSGAGGVIYTRRKSVHKPRHAKPGLVQAGQVKSIYVRLDKNRIDRLYDTRSD
jgi:predicted ribosome quality control (RQC) complex YloA/Tae2 family protein